MPAAWKNKLFFGDNLKVLREEIADESVDLVYLDPPFNSNASYNVLFKENSGEKSSAQITAFDDTWHWGEEAEAAYREVVEAGGKLGSLLAALLSFLGRNDMMAYLTMMAPRLKDLHRALKPTGSLYLHCDPTASHYLKLVLDAIFEPAAYVNEIVWKRSTAHSDRGQGAKHFGRIHDVLLFYTKSDDHVFQGGFEDHSSSYLESHYKYVDPDTGRRYRFDNLTGPGGAAKGNPQYEVMGVVRFWRYSRERMQDLIRQGRVVQTRPGAVPQYKRYLDESKGRPVQDVWDDIPPINSQAQERLGYPTQKPEALLERVVTASSNVGDVVLDPFCGCGTTISVAERLHRRWIGIDVTHLAISLIRNRLRDTFKDELHPYDVHGVPSDLASAQALAEVDRHQFEWWALGMVDARPAQDRKKGADSGVDGRMVFFDDRSLTPRNIVLQVKSGHVKAGDIRDLKGVVDREKAAIGVYVTLEEPTKPMIKEAVSSGFYEPADFPGQRVPRIQILTIEDILAGKRVAYPRVAPAATFKVAEPKAKQKGGPKRLL